MRLTELEPRLMGRPYIDREGRQSWRTDALSIAYAAGIQFLCPICFEKNGGPVGTHTVVCWDGSVPPVFVPTPGRWDRQGDSFENLTLVGAGEKSDSVLLTTEGGCKAHFFVRNGEIEFT